MSITTKRKAQDLVRQGKIEEAVEEMREGVSEGNADPYDHVYLGDLLMRLEETESGIRAYETAISSYEDVGLFRNAIAIGKKLLRVDPERNEVHRTLGRLYDQDDLQGEAIPHYLCYLDSLSGETLPPQEFLQILDRAASITGSKVEVALRLTDHFLRLKKGDRAAALLDSVADHCDRAGSEEIAADLRERAKNAASVVTEESRVEPAVEPADDGHVTIDLDTVDLNVGNDAPVEVPPIPLDDSLFAELEVFTAETAAEETDADAMAGDFKVVHFPGQDREASGPSDPLDFDSVDLTAGIEAALSGSGEAETDPEATEGTDSVDELDLTDSSDSSDSSEFGEVDLAIVPDDASSKVWEIANEGPTEFGAVDLDQTAQPTEVADLETLDLDACGSDDSISAVSLESADDDYLEGRWFDARSKYESLLEIEPNQRRILSKLVETVRYLEDIQSETHYLILLGDAWISEEEYEEAMHCFLGVLKHDPENETAKRRLARFRDLGVAGADGIDEATSNSVPSLLETGGTEVAIKNSDGAEFRSEDWVELEGLLEEFNAGLKEQMDESDYQAHYDLAVSHHSMGLLEEALESLDRALACSEIPIGVQRQARELKGGCLLGLKRNREAVHEYRETLEQARDDVDARRTALHNLGRALESVEEWQEAYQTFSQLRIEAPGHLDVEASMRRVQSRFPDRSNPEAA